LKNNNNIDQLFERKLNNQSFELKDSYITDFESNLDVYNKKGKGFFWLFFAVTSLTIGIVYDFVILPSFNTPATQELSINSSNSLRKKSKNQKETNIENPVFINRFDLGTIENTSDVTKKNSIVNNTNTEEFSLSKVALSNVANLAKNNKGKNFAQTNNTALPFDSKENKVSSEDTKHSKKLNNQSNTAVNLSVPETKVPDVYIDDTIRRQVFVIDTIIIKDTIIVTDTIKRKFRLFKKKI